MTTYEDTMPLAALTIGDFKDLMREYGITQSPQQKPEKHYVYGLRGIEQLFGVSHATAQHYKDTFLQPAVIQQGRKIMIDAELAVELFHKAGNE